MITQTMPRCFCELAFDTVIVQKPVGDGLFYIFFQKYYFLSLFNPFLTNVPLMQKPGSWFLLAKCLKNTCGRGDQIDDLHFYLKAASLFFKPKRKHLSNQDKCFLFHYKSSFRSRENQILEFQIFKFHDIKCLSITRNTFH